MTQFKFGIILALSGLMGIIGCADNIDRFNPDDIIIEEPPVEIVGDISNFFDAIDESEVIETFSGYIDWGFMIVTDRETVIDIPFGGFVNPSTGATVTGVVDIEVKELRTRGEILLYGVQTESYGTLLESGGEFHITASQNGQELDLVPGKQIRIRAKDDNPKNEMELWYTKEVIDPITGESSETWDDADDDPNSWGNVFVSEWAITADSSQGGGDIIEGFGYECWSDSLNWINMDVFYNLPEDEVTDACVALPDSFSNTNSIVYLVFEDLNMVIILPGNPESMQFCNYYTNYILMGIPLGEAVKFISISELGDDCYYFALSETIVTENMVEDLVPEKMPFDDIKDIIMGL